MTEFLAALAAFVVAHLVPSMPGVRPRLVAAMGRGSYLAAYSIASLALAAWLVVAARRTDAPALWEPAAWQWVLPVVVMPFALFLLVAGLAEANPLSVSLRRPEDGCLPSVAAVTRHPVLWGFLLWALAHVPANGRLVPVILFGSMALMAAAGMPLLDRKASRRLGDETWRRLADRASLWPFAAALAGQAPRPALGRLAVYAAVAVAIDAWFLLQGHQLLIGPDPLEGMRAFFS